MSKLVLPSGLLPAWGRRAMCVCLLLLASCGGGGGDPGHPAGGGGGGDVQAGVGSGGTGSYSNGPITGFGSIIVNDVHYNHESASSIEKDDDGDPGETKPIADSLKLGMTVEVDVAPGGALNIRFGSDLLGQVTGLPVTSAAGVTLKVMNHDVLIVLGGVKNDNNTHVGDESDEDVGGDTDIAHENEALDYLNELKLGDVVEVYGFENPSTHVYKATRIRLVKRKDPVEAYAGAYVVRGVIENLHVARGAISCDVAGQHIAYALTSDMSSLSNGKVARFQLATSSPPAAWTATDVVVSTPWASSDRGDAAVTGFVTLVDHATKRFSVNGVPVDASLLGISTPSLGDPVTVKGSFVNGTVKATEVTARSP